jgi:hypothetical protein
MMRIWIAAALVSLLQSAPSPQRATVSPQTFVGTWVGTQRWAIANPPPGANPEQPVSMTIELVDGKLTGVMTPFLGGQDGATLVDVRIVGDELQASAIVGRPRGASGAGRGAAAAVAPAGEEESAAPAGGSTGRVRGNQPTWKDAIKIQFVFRNDGLDLRGAADLMMNDVKWVKFNYDLSKKRSRY